MKNPPKNEPDEIEDWQTPRKGSIAICSLGMLGLITSDGLEEITYSDGNTGLAFIGIHLNMQNLGNKWSSRNPVIIGHVQELEDWMNISLRLEKVKIIKEKGAKLLKNRRDKDGR